MSDKEWLASLKPGDKVAKSRGNWSRSYDIATVERLTATQITLSNGRKYRRDSGYEIGGAGYARSYLTEITPEILSINELVKLRSWLDGLSSSKLELPALRALKAAYDAQEQAK